MSVQRNRLPAGLVPIRRLHNKAVAPYFKLCMGYTMSWLYQTHFAPLNLCKGGGFCLFTALFIRRYSRLSLVRMLSPSFHRSLKEECHSLAALRQLGGIIFGHQCRVGVLVFFLQRAIAVVALTTVITLSPLDWYDELHSKPLVIQSCEKKCSLREKTVVAFGYF